MYSINIISKKSIYLLFRIAFKHKFSRFREQHIEFLKNKVSDNCFKRPYQRHLYVQPKLQAIETLRMTTSRRLSLTFECSIVLSSRGTSPASLRRNRLL